MAAPRGTEAEIGHGRMAAALERALGPAGPEADASVPEAPLLVLGPAGSGRTALLLRAALAGGGDGPRALFLAPSAPSRLPEGGGGDPRALQRLELRYPPTLAALAQELGAMAARARPPGLLLLDGLEHYIQGGPSAPARLAALLLEASRAPRPPARLLAALRVPPPGPRVLPVLRRYFPAECRLRPLPGVPLRVNVRLVLPGSVPRGWRLRFEPHGGLNVTPGPGDGDGDEDEDGDGSGDEG